MPAPPPDARSQRATVTSVRATGADGVVLRVRLACPTPPLRAARFFMLRRADRLSPAIPRPFSVYRMVDCALSATGHVECEIEFLIKVMGEGTRALAASKPGDELLAVGPLGHGWPTIDGAGDPWVMVAGGIGSAPFYMGIQQALEGMDGQPPCRPDQLTLIYGGRTQGFLYDLDEFRDLGVRVIPATDDGSSGFHGNVVEALRAEWHAGRLPLQVRLLTCGPDRMMEAVAHVARDNDLPCWVSLETYMGCGVGICNGCAVPTSADGELCDWPVVKCCVDGPVFNARDVLV
ncbi:MAG: dihydroorotate dehydrogenase electron transfer subunit [Planctomycetota bacterium]